VAQPIPHEEQVTYARVGYTLLGGLWLSVIVMVAGFLLAAASGIHQVSHVTPLQDVASGLQSGKASAVLSLGILLLFATPFAGVLVALVQFLRLRDLPFVWVTVVLLIILIIGFAIALR
jgi:uncharacterized membrane protein